MDAPTSSRFTLHLDRTFRIATVTATALNIVLAFLLLHPP